MKCWFLNISTWSKDKKRCENMGIGMHEVNALKIT